MNFTSYQLVGNNSSSLNSASYFNQTEYSLFINSFIPDLWFGYSAQDVIEISAWDRQNNFIGWDVFNQSKSYNEVTLSYLNPQNLSSNYSYKELQNDFLLYNNSAILVTPSEAVTNISGMTSGSYYLTYNFTREMAGTNLNPLIIKDVSPSRTELKLIPLSGSDNVYTAFCKQQILLQNVTPKYLQFIESCPYSAIYSSISSQYVNEIDTIKSLFYLNTDGAMIDFLKNLYEDRIIYTAIPTQNGSISSHLITIQGIKTYFTNYLLSNSDTILNFSDIDNNFNSFVSASVIQKFTPIGSNTEVQYVNAKQFIYDFFTKFYYQPISNELADSYNKQYYSYLTNALNFGDNNLLPILNIGFLDERTIPTDPLTLLVKLASDLPTNIMAQTQCWVSNIAITPFVINAIINSSNGIKIYKIGSPNFSLPMPNMAITNNNVSYTSEDLQLDQTTQREVTISKNLANLNIDYSDFKNFIVFSSAEVRLNIFKNKIINISTINSSIQSLNNLNEQFIMASGSTYPFYSNEYNNFQGNIDNIVNSFDGFESYSYRSGNYVYQNSQFISSSFISDMDTEAKQYDKKNRDSLINNCPSHILLDTQNDDYIVFLAMVGQFFDSLYEYITNLSVEKKAGNSSTEEFTRTVVDYMLETFGWKVDDILEQSDLINNYLSSAQNSSINSSMSAEDRLKTIRNRILFNLPKIYKTKGTQEAINMLLSCYGIPSVLLSIREYGGVNNSDDVASYTTYERVYMYQWNTSSIYDSFSLPAPSTVSTYLTKICIDDSTPYTYGIEQTLFGRVDSNVTTSSISASGDWAVGFVRSPAQNAGKVFFRIGYQGQEQFTIYSDSFPLFDGNVYSIMLRRNTPSSEYEFNTNIDAIPCRYDLYVQRNENGIPSVYITSSAICYDLKSNQIFDVSPVSSSINIGGWFANVNGQGFTGAMDKWQMWYNPVTDSNFNDYVNSINSYSFSGSIPSEQALLFRMHTDYPFDMAIGTWTNANPFYACNSIQTQEAVLNVSNAVSIDTMTNTNAWAGAQTLVYNSASCQFVSQSAYPFQFKVIDYLSTWPTTYYGPNRFRNEKIVQLSQSISTKFDDKTRSTYVPLNSTSPDSNQVGLYVDPQDFKNKDIIRFFGNFNFMDAIGSPQNQYCEEYESLRQFRNEYVNVKNQYSGSRTLFNELMILYKLYFNTSVFAAIENLVPARTNTLTGVLIEPTVLERPKYKYKQVYSEVNTGSVFYAEVNPTHYSLDPDKKLLKMSESLLYGDFNLNTASISGFNSATLPSNLNIDLPLTYINDPNIDYPVNYTPSTNYIADMPDKYQLGCVGTLNGLYQFNNNHITNGEIPFDPTISIHPSGSNTYYLMKRWKKYSIYAKSGSWNRSASPNTNLYNTCSTYLYDYICVSSNFFNNTVYTSSMINNVPGNPGSEYGLGFQWIHYPNTFKGFPNSTTNNYLLTGYFNGTRWIYEAPSIFIDDGEYLEIVGGYPRNHFTHKRDLFSLYSEVSYGIQNGNIINGLYKRNQQTMDSTINETGLEDGSLPITITQVSNINLVQSNNVINQ